MSAEAAGKRRLGRGLEALLGVTSVEEAARDGRHLKDLVAELLQSHVKNAEGNGKGKTVKKGK